MDDKQVDVYITRQIRKRGITVYDIIGGKHIDPTPDAIEPPPGQRARSNRLSCVSPCLRVCELLTPKGFDSHDPYRRLAVPVKDFVRYWWNNCVEQESVLDDIFEDILEYHKDRMLPPKTRRRRRILAKVLMVF